MNERKTPTAELRQTPTNDVRDGFDKEAGWGDEEAKAKLVAEQARIQQHYKRLVQQRKDYEQSGGDLVDEVYQGATERPERSDHKESLPASLAAARPGSRSGITGTGSSDPRFANYNDEIQRHLNRRQAQYHSQVGNSTSMWGLFSINNFISAARAPGQVRQARVQLLRVRVCPVQHLARPPDQSDQHRQWRSDAPTWPSPRHQDTAQTRDAASPSPDYDWTSLSSTEHPRWVSTCFVFSICHYLSLFTGIGVNNPLSVKPSNYGYYGTTRVNKNDYEDHRNFQGNPMADYDDPYGRIVFRDGTSIPAGRRPSHPGQGQTVPHSSSGHRMQHSLSHPRIQSHQGWNQTSSINPIN